MSQDKKEFSLELLKRAKKEFFLSKGIQSPFSENLEEGDKERLMKFHNYIKERVKKMFTPMTDEGVIRNLPEDFFDKFEFCYDSTNVPNACTFPEFLDGKATVVITQGLIDLCENEDELMSVVGHEVGHQLHKIFKPYKENNVPEEAWCDIISMAHMSNANYHPRYMVNILNKICDWSRKHIPTPKYKLSDIEQIIQDIYDPHPEYVERETMGELVTEAKSHKYQNIGDIPLNREIINLSDLSSLKGVLTIETDGPLFQSGNDNATQSVAEMKRILDILRSEQVLLGSDKYRFDNNIWTLILHNYIYGKGNEWNVELVTPETAQNYTFTSNVLNDVYWTKLKILNNAVQTTPIINTLWTEIAHTLTKHNPVVDELGSVSCSVMNYFLSKSHIPLHSPEYYAYETEREKMLPREIVETRKIIKDIIENPSTAIPKFLSGKSTENENAINNTIRILQCMIPFDKKIGYLSVQNAEYLLCPVIDMTNGKENPFSKFVSEMEKYETQSTKDSDTARRFEYLKNLIYTIGYYDTSIHKVNEPILNLLDGREEVYEFEGLSSKDVSEISQAFFSFRSPISCRTGLYDVKTKNVIKENHSFYRYPSNKISEPCQEYKIISHISYLATHYEHRSTTEWGLSELYDLKTSYLNAQMHYKLKDIFQSFKTDKVDAQEAKNLIQFYQHYMKPALERDKIITLDEKIPLGIDGMHWTYHIGSNRERPISSKIAAMYKGRSDEYLFDYFDNRDAYLDIYENMSLKYIKLLREGLKNPEIAQVFVDYFKDSKGYQGGLLILGANEPHRCGGYLNVKSNFWECAPEVLSLINNEPYLSAFDEHAKISFYSDSISMKGLQNIYVSAPNLCARIYGLYEEDEKGNRTYVDLPVQSFEELKKMKRIIEGNPFSDWRQEDRLNILRIAHNQYLKEGHSDVSMDFSLPLFDNEILSISSNKAYNPLVGGSDITKDKELYDAYMRNLNNLENWPASCTDCIKLIAQHGGYATLDNHSNSSILADVAPPVLFQAYHQKLLEATSYDEKVNILSNSIRQYEQYGQKFEIWGLSKNTTEQILSVKGDSIWNGSIDDNLRLYQWLSKHMALENITLRTEIVQHLITQLEKTPVEKKEEYSFMLLEIKSRVPSPAQRDVLMNMWIQSVGQLVGGKDDMTSGYIEKVLPYKRKLFNEQDETSAIEESYSVIPMDIQSELSRKLQDHLVTQPQLSHLLEPKQYQGKFADSKKSKIGGSLTKILNFSGPSGIKSLIECLLNGVTPERVQELNKNLSKDIEHIFSHQNYNYNDINDYENRKKGVKEISVSQDVIQNMYDEFWSKSIEFRIVFLADAFKRAYNNKERFENMMSRILPNDMENRDIFYTGLKNYATAVHQGEMYRAEILLLGCLAAAPRKEDGEMNMGESIRKFLESQGAAGIKVGQFLCAHSAVPSEIREELKQLTNNATPPSRNDVFKIIETNHPELMDLIMKKGGLGKCLGAASHYLTYEMGEHEVLSVSRPESGAKAEEVYQRLIKGVGRTLEEKPEHAHMLHIIRDAVVQAYSMNDVELNANIGYEQAVLATRLYDDVEMEVDGHHFVFKTMPWKEPNEETGPYHVRVKDGEYEYSQSFKIMEKAEGINYDEIQDPAYKTAVAKANFLLNLRTIVAGSVFDDDRHVGQLKVERMGDAQTRINLFDTGSMSTEPPTAEELNSFGKTIYLTYRALSELQSNKSVKEKQKALKTLFPNTPSVDRLFKDGNSNEPNNLLFDSFNMAIDTLRTENSAPLYISKVERALANLTHFSKDIPSDEVLPLFYKLFDKTSQIHPEIKKGIEESASSVEKSMLDFVLPQGRFNSDLVLKSETVQENTIHIRPIEDLGVWTKRSISTGTMEGDTVVTSPIVSSHSENMNKTLENLSVPQQDGVQISFGEKNVSLIDAVDTLLNTKFESQEEQKEYEKTIGQICAKDDDVDIMTHLNTCFDNIKSPTVKQKINNNIQRVMKSFLHEVQKNKTSENIANDIVQYLCKKGLSQPMLDALIPKKSIKNMLIRGCFVGGKLNLFSGRAASVINGKIKNVTNQAFNAVEQMRNILSADVKMLAPKPRLPERGQYNFKTGERIEKFSNDVLQVVVDSYKGSKR
ncbi:MAG: M48 family metalloprotease [Alphaproteobacteria bacterium]|nr:M48 family metalloprotease [Alphaproteobacteria bacterium]